MQSPMGKNYMTMTMSKTFICIPLTVVTRVHTDPRWPSHVFDGPVCVCVWFVGHVVGGGSGEWWWVVVVCSVVVVDGSSGWWQ